MAITLPYNIVNGQAIDAVPVMANFNALATALPASGSAASSGANSDITSLTGLTTPLSVHQGGLGGTNPQGGNTLDMTLRNLIDNGAFNVAQRYGTVAQTTSGNVVLDRWSMYNTATPRLSWQQLASTTPGFSNKAHAVVTAAGAPAAGDFYLLQQFLENLTMAPMNWGTAQAQNLVLSFTAICSITGTFSVSLRNAAANRSYVTTFTIAAANTPQRFTIPIPGDTGGTWIGWNGGASVGSLFVGITLGCGTTNQTSTLNTWQAGASLAASTATQLVATGGATFDLMGVQLEVDGGDHTATAFESLPFDYELRRAQRFLPATIPGAAGLNDIGTALFGSTSAGTAMVMFGTLPRIPPTGIAFSGGGSAGNFSATTPGTFAALSALTFVSSGFNSSRLAFSQAGTTWAASAAGWLYANAGSTSALLFTGAEL